MKANLRELAEKILNDNPDENLIDLFISFYEQASKDMYQKEFIEWIIDKNSPIAICYGSKTPFATTHKDYTLDELYYYWQADIKNK